MLTLSKNQEFVKYLMSSRRRTDSLAYLRELPNNLCRLFWETVIRIVLETAALFVAALTALGMVFQLLHIVSGLGVVKIIEGMEFLPGVMYFLGGIGLFTLAILLAVLVLGMAIYGLNELFNHYGGSIKKTKPVNVTYEYAKSIKDRWCPMVQYEESSNP